MPAVQRASIDPAAREQLRPHLKAGEALTWAGFPAKGRFSRGSWFFFAFGIPWTAFVLFWEGGVLMSASGITRVVMAVFGLPFVAIGVFMLLAPFKAMRTGRDLVYGATPDRLLIVRTGGTPAVRSYGPADLAEIRTQEDKGGLWDVYFAVDTDVADFMPAAGTKGTLDKVGFVGVPKEAARAAEAVRAQRKPGSPSGPLPAIAAAGEPAARLEARGTLEACCVKLAGLLAEQAASRARRRAIRQSRFWMVAAPLLVAPPAIGFASEGFGGAGIGLFVSLMVGTFAAVARYAMNHAAATEDAEARRFEAVQGLLAAWQQDGHPKARIHAVIDFGPATGVRPYRFANSASSGALKTYHRHRWARFAWATACGSPLVVELVDKVKYKAGSEVERHPRLRGWLVPNEAVWRVSDLTEPFTAGGLTVTPREIAGRRVLIFHGAVADPAAAGQAIAALYRALAERRPAGR